MDWVRIMTPLSGAESDRRALTASSRLADAFGAELLCVHAPADVADIIPWMGDAFMGGVQATAMDSIRQAADEGERLSRAMVEAQPYERATFVSLRSPVWAALAISGRLSDVVVFDDASARGRGPMSRCFQQIVADEQRPTLVVKGVLNVGGVAAVAWDGGKEASRALRTALPLLHKASSVVVIAAPAAASRKFDPADLQDFLRVRGIASEVKLLAETGDPAQAILAAARAMEASILVAGAFGHPRLREFVFGSATRAFLHGEGPSLFLSH